MNRAPVVKWSTDYQWELIQGLLTHDLRGKDAELFRYFLVLRETIRVDGDSVRFINGLDYERLKDFCNLTSDELKGLVRRMLTK